MSARRNPGCPGTASKIRHKNETEPFATYVRQLQRTRSGGRYSPQSLRPDNTTTVTAQDNQGSDGTAAAEAAQGTLEHLNPNDLVLDLSARSG